MRIFVAELHEGELAIGGDEHHYLSHVRRARVGDELELVDGRGTVATAAIASIGKAETTVRVSGLRQRAEPMPRIRVLLPLIKGPRMDTCIEKLVEVGTSEIHFWQAERSVVKAGPEKLERYRAIVEAAARQSGCVKMPSVAWTTSAAFPTAGARVVLDPEAPRAPFPVADDITIVSGPEGGLAPEELARLDGWTRIGLGPRVLRAETAPVVAVALVRAQTGS